MSSPSPAAVRRTAANATALVAAYVIGRGLAFVAVVVAARIVGAEAFGMYGAAAALAVVLSLVSTLGMVPLLVREMARAPADAGRWLAAADRVKHGSNLLMLAALWVTAGPVLGLEAQAVAASLLLGIGYALGSYVENRLAWSRAVERMALVAVASTVYGVVAGVLGAVGVAVTGSVVVFCAAPLVAQLAVLAWLRTRLPADLRGAGTRRGDVAALVSAVLPFAAAFVALTVFTKVDILLLEHFRPREEVGMYAAAYRFVDLAHALTLAGVGAVYPALARRAGASGDGGPRRAARMAELLLLVAVPAGAILFLGREAAVVGLFGGGYSEAVSVLAWLAPAIPALAFNLYGGQLLAASDRMRWMAWLYGGGVLVKVGFDLWLIPGWGVGGAAVATLVSEVALSAGFAAVLAEALGTAPGRRTVGVLVAVVLLAALAARLSRAGEGLLPAAVFGLATLAVYGVVEVVTPGERVALRHALSPHGDRGGRGWEPEGSG